MLIPVIYIPILYVPFWMEVVFEMLLVIMTIIAFIYEARTWVTGKSGDYCFFEGAQDKSIGLISDCDPNDASCFLNKNYK
jgi:hypothetical protein